MDTTERSIRDDEPAARLRTAPFIAAPAVASPAGQAAPPAIGAPFDRFTPKTRQILAAAAEQARHLGHHAIQPEHLLLALLLEPDSGILRPLRAAVRRVDLGNLRETLVERLASIEHASVPGLAEPTGLSEGCKQVLQLALAEAGRFRSVQVGPAHLLLGIVMEGSALAGTSVLAGLAARGLQVSLGTRGWRPGNPSEAIAARRGAVAATTDATASTGGEPGPRHADTRDNVITFRVTDEDLAAVDTLVDSGAMKTRSEASAWLLQSGIAANRDYFDEIRRIGDEIARLRHEVERLTEAHIGRTTAPEEQADARLPA